jgi:hypothetical protein
VAAEFVVRVQQLEQMRQKQFASSGGDGGVALLLSSSWAVAERDFFGVIAGLGLEFAALPVEEKKKPASASSFSRLPPCHPSAAAFLVHLHIS